MPNKHGDFIWYELMTTEPEAAKAFYDIVVGWNIGSAAPAGDVEYRMIGAGDDFVGGVLTLTDEMKEGGAFPLWIGYVGVDDVDAAAKQAVAAGAELQMEPFDIPDAGRAAMISDPQGAPLYLMRGNSEDESNVFARYEPKLGHCAWNELATSDPEAAKAFYGAQFGWEKDGEMDMGPMGTYEFLKMPGERPYMLGAVYPKTPEMPVSAWTFYFRVPDIDVAAEAIKANGGNLFQDPIEIPGGDYSLNAADPQGAAFGLVGPRK